MHSKISISLALAAALTLAGLALGDGKPGWGPPEMPPYSRPIPPATQPATTQPFQAVDLRNTVCPVSGEKIGDSNLVEVYDGKIYHLCCDDCYKDFEKDPSKYAKAVSDESQKYGIK